MSDKITLTEYEIEKIKNASIYIKNEQWDKAFESISNRYEDNHQYNAILHIISFLKEKNIDLMHKITKIPILAFEQCSELKSIEIPNNVTGIEYGAFQDCGNLEKVILPNSIKYIEDDVFTGCDELYDYYYDGTEEEWDKIEQEDGLEHAGGLHVIFMKK